MKPLNKVIKCKPRIGLGGKVKVEVVNSKTKNVVPFMYGDQEVIETPWIPNLILNNWVEKLNSTAWNWFAGDHRYHLCLQAHVGQGTSDNKTASGAVTASQTGTTVTLSAPLAAMQAGRIIKWASGEWAYIASGAGTAWVVYQSQTVASGLFTVYHTGGTTMENFTKTYNSTLSTTETTWDTGTGVKTITRVYDFSSEASNVNYYEVGIGPSDSEFNGYSGGGTDLWARIKLPSSVSVTAGNQIRVTYALTFTIGPRTDQASAMVISGWDNTGVPGEDTGAITERCVNFTQALNPRGTDTVGALHPSGVGDFGRPTTPMYLTTSTSIPAVSNNGGTSVTYLSPGKTPSKAYLGTGTFTYRKTGVFQVGDANSTSIRGIYLGIAAQPGFMCLFTNAVTKDDTHKLTVIFEIQITPEYS